MPSVNFEILHALRCVLVISEASFSCMHTVHTFIPPSSHRRLVVSEKYDMSFHVR